VKTTECLIYIVQEIWVYFISIRMDLNVQYIYIYIWNIFTYNFNNFVNIFVLY
jgi:hypothetical protein